LHVYIIIAVIKTMEKHYKIVGNAFFRGKSSLCEPWTAFPNVPAHATTPLHAY